MVALVIITGAVLVLASSRRAIGRFATSLPLGALLVFILFVILIEMQQVHAAEVVVVRRVAHRLIGCQLFLNLLPDFLLQCSLLPFELLSINLKMLQLLLFQGALYLGALRL